MTSEPPRPRLTLRIGFAGRKALDATADAHLRTQLLAALQQVGQTLAALAPGVPVQLGQEPPISRFYARRSPLLRLVTGLCEGADWVAGEVLRQVQITPDPNQSTHGNQSAPSTPATEGGGSANLVNRTCLETELAAVLPFASEHYRASRPPGFLKYFDAQLARCAYVLELDGIYDKPSPDTPLAKQRRARAYRAQAAFLLRHSDLLIAAANPDDASKAGGTLETIREALAFELPVLLIHTGTGAVYLFEPDDEFHAVLAAAPDAAWRNRLQNWVQQIVADPDLALPPTVKKSDEHGRDRGAGADVLQEYFDRPGSPADVARRWGVRLRKWAWARLESWVTRKKVRTDDPTLEPYVAYRRRATDLNYHYSGLYRGAFVLNYALAVVAVALAAASLVLIGSASHTALGEDLLNLLSASGTDLANVVSNKPKPWLLPLLMGLAAVKLLIVIFISRNTRRANHEHWNDHAVDTRYLAERLRTLYYLPRLGAFQPPAIYPPQFAARVVRQSHIDWLCEAIVRSVSPADLPDAQTSELTVPGQPPVIIRRRLHVAPQTVLQTVRDAWVDGQARYHSELAHKMHTLHHRMEQGQKWLGWIVIAVVAVDLVLIGGKISHKLHWMNLPAAFLDFAKVATPWLIFVSALLPAVIAALGGLRFQSECQRLAERSSVMRSMLKGRGDAAGGRYAEVDALLQRIQADQADGNAADPAAPKTPTPTDLGSYAHEALRLTERIAKDFVHEAAEWSVLYAKELGDPG
jgi:hypothetical protein